MLTQKAFYFDLDIDDKFGNWLAGFTDGEGCFRIAAKECKHTHVKKNGKNTIAHHSGTQFQIKLRVDDIGILLEIKEKLKCGDVRIVQGSTKNGNLSALFLVANASDLKFIIVPFFEKYQLRAKKRRDFEIWKKAVDICHLAKIKRQRTSNEDQSLPKYLWDELLKLSDELKEVRKPESIREYLKAVPISKLSRFVRTTYGHS